MLPSFVNGRVLLVRSPRRLQILRAHDKENGQQDEIEGNDAHEQPFDQSTLVGSEAVQVPRMQRHQYPQLANCVAEQSKMEGKLLCVRAFTQQYVIY